MSSRFQDPFLIALEAYHERVLGPCERFMCSNTNGKKEATHSCLDCQKYYCDSCVRSHKKEDEFKKHRVVSIRKEDRIFGELYCRVHFEELEFFCIDCNALICTSCIYRDHSSHSQQKLGNSHTFRKRGREPSTECNKQVSFFFSTFLLPFFLFFPSNLIMNWIKEKGTKPSKRF